MTNDRHDVLEANGNLEVALASLCSSNDTATYPSIGIHSAQCLRSVIETVSPLERL